MNEYFPCTSCGACCKSIKLSTLTDWLDRNDGVCKYFDESTNTCSIYEIRPVICNVSSMYNNHYKNIFTWTDFIQINKKACVELLKLQGREH